ncbi:facilitated trehalose transporter Tret1-like [Daktulosphaira vitifoliae]|uniref:facilitated trehalose transporter Tret1-like n=1 Tax=Daktulosphaira vitifoliae TaxID=58002 RepID=UPI0021AB0137|nr:facilitated trehalose transporter Tret1-like [Daktulosphaira vitifoliae]
MVSRGVLNQFWAAITGSLSIMNVGIILGWTSPIMKELLGPNSPIPMSVDESSWFVSIIDWGLIVGSIPFGILSDRWGRKLSLLLIGPLALFTWIGVLWVDNFRGLLIIRFFQGLLSAGAYTILPVYAGEIAGSKIRGALGTMFQILMYVGILYVYVIGTYLDFKNLTYALMVGPILFFVLFLFVPESPHFYIMQNRLPDAKRSLIWLRGVADQSIDEEMDSAVDCICKEMRNASFSELFTDHFSLKALAIVQGLSVFRVMAGITALISYASITFSEMHVDIDPNKLSIIFACSVLFAALPSTILSDYVGRRPLMMISCTFCFVFDTAIFGYFYLDRKTNYDVIDYGWLCVAAVGGLSVAHTIGLGSLLSTINCELFPSNTRSTANAINTITLTIVSFLALKIYPVLAVNEGMYRNYLISSLFSLLSIICCYIWLPETKGKTFASIQAQFRKINNDLG